MAAYAALASLINNLEQIRNHPRLSTSFIKKEMKVLLKRLDFLLVFIERYNSYGGSEEETEDLERQIASAAHAAEDVIESRIVDQILTGSPEEGFSFLEKKKQIKEKVFRLLEKMQLRKSCLQGVLQDMDSIHKKVMKVDKERGCKVELPPQSSSSMPAASSTHHSAGKTKMIGFDGYSTQLLSKLTGHQLDRLIIPIVGMGGLGKTTLARNAFDSFPVVRHFIVRAWVVVSQTYILRDVLCEILSCLGVSKYEMDKKAEHELRELLHKTLFDRRYLVVLDDMWSIEAWDRIKFFFPNNCNGSRILVTTRISDVAYHLDSIPFELSFLDDAHSWELFCENVFPQEVCPLELEESGKKIVRKCRGLPLAIVVIGGLLRSIFRTQDQWESVEKDITSILNTTNDNQCLKLLSMSYSHLPARLKPCFLYLGIFPEDHVIHASRLVKLWVAEGFIKPNKDLTLEEIAESYVKNLVDRNLISVDSIRWNGKVKTFRVHDLLRDLCIRVAEKEKFLCITSELGTPQEMDNQRRVLIHGSTGEEYYRFRSLGTLNSGSLSRSLIFNQGIRQVHVKSRLLRVLVGVYSEPRDIIFQQVNLRFLAQECFGLVLGESFIYDIPSSISLLWNVQTLIITGVEGLADRVVAPSGIWKMKQLRHVMCHSLTLPELPPGDDAVVLHNLQTLGKVVDCRFIGQVFDIMPKIRKLHVCFSFFLKGSTNFASFSKLESLHYQVDRRLNGDNLLQYLKFPNSLKKLTLAHVSLRGKDMAVISSLPTLEVLKLDNTFFNVGSNWDSIEGKFLRLRFLQIVGPGLVHWNADDTHFPVLENLVLVDLVELNEIPSGFGEIQTLERISLAYCSDSSALSALKILEEQRNFGNKELLVKVLLGEYRVKTFMQQVEAEGLSGLDYQLDIDRRI